MAESVRAPEGTEGLGGRPDFRFQRHGRAAAKASIRFARGDAPGKPESTSEHSKAFC
jgi:hypothetical protein